MNVLKFGGTSVTGLESQLNIFRLLSATNEPVILVLSAFSQVTNKLEKIASLNKSTNEKEITDLFNQLKALHLKMILQLDFQTLKNQDAIVNEINEDFIQIESIYAATRNSKYLLAQGEYLSTKLLNAFFLDRNLDSKLFDSANFIYTNADLEPDTAAIENAFQSQLFENQINIFQGFVCTNHLGQISNLQRGGSDYTATIIGAAIGATEVQIWTDIDGFHNNDPRYIENTFPVRYLSFDEAAELAYFGAKILHPNCLQPVRRKNIPVVLKNTLAIDNQGTLISEKTSNRMVTAIAAKDNIHVIRIESARMLNAHGFLFKIFSVFNKYGKSIDTITTSEVSVSLTIDNEDSIYDILNELKEFGKVAYETNMSIICVVGDFLSNRLGIASKVLDSLKDIPLRMISYGGSENNITLLTATENKLQALRLLHAHLFVNTEDYARV